MKMEEHFRDTLERAVANEPPVIDSWANFERRVRRDRGVRVFGSVAAIVAVLVAAVIVVPRLGRTPGIVLNPPESPSPTSSRTNDAYSGWATYDYELYSVRLRHPMDWRIVVFEANPEILAPGQSATAVGEPSMAVTVALLNAKLYDPQWQEFGFNRSTRPDGRRFVWKETEVGGGRRTIEYSIDWSTCVQPTGASSCAGTARTLFVTIHIGTKALGDQYRETAEKIVTSIEYVGPVGRSSVS